MEAFSSDFKIEVISIHIIFLKKTCTCVDNGQIADFFIGVIVTPFFHFQLDTFNINMTEADTKISKSF